MAISVRLDPALEAAIDAEARRLGITRTALVKDSLERRLGLKNPADLLRAVRSDTPMGNPDASEQVSARVKAKLRAQHPAWCGALIALFACDDKHHRHFDDLVTALSGDGLRLSTTCPCVVEASYLLEPPQRFEMLRWIELGGALVYPFNAQQLGDIIESMQRYTETGKREMDLADASLYWLAVETGTTEIMTVDIADFSRYRLPNKHFFAIL